MKILGQAISVDTNARGSEEQPVTAAMTRGPMQRCPHVLGVTRFLAPERQQNKTALDVSIALSG